MKHQAVGFHWGIWRNNLIGLEEIDVGHMRSAKKVCLGEGFALILDKEGIVWSWGISKEGCLGLGERKENKKTRTISRIPLGEEYVEDIAVGDSHVLALTRKRQVYSWGSNRLGQLGRLDQEVGVPKLIHALAAVKSIYAWKNTSFAINHDGALFGWGDNSNGQLIKSRRKANCLDTPTELGISLASIQGNVQLAFFGHAAMIIATEEADFGVGNLENSGKGAEDWHRTHIDREIQPATIKRSERSAEKSELTVAHAQGERGLSKSDLKDLHSYFSKLEEIKRNMEEFKNKEAAGTHKKENTKMYRRLKTDLSGLKTQFYQNISQAEWGDSQTNDDITKYRRMCIHLLSEAINCCSMNLTVLCLSKNKTRLELQNSINLNKCQERNTDISISCEQLKYESLYHTVKVANKLDKDRWDLKSNAVGMDRLSYMTFSYCVSSLKSQAQLWIAVSSLYSDIVLYQYQAWEQEQSERLIQSIFDEYEKTIDALDTLMDSDNYSTIEFQDAQTYFNHKLRRYDELLVEATDKLEQKRHEDPSHLSNYSRQTIKIIFENFELKKMIACCQQSLITSKAPFK